MGTYGHEQKKKLPNYLMHMNKVWHRQEKDLLRELRMQLKRIKNEETPPMHADLRREYHGAKHGTALASKSHSN